MGAVLPFVGMALTLVGGAKQASGEEMSSRATAQSYAYQAMISRNNAIMAQRNEQWTSEQGDIESTNEGLKTGAEVASMKAKQAASGVDVNTGSAVSVRDAAARLGAINAMTIKSNRAREVWGYQVDKTNEETQAKLQDRAGGYALQGGKISSAATLLGTASSVVGQYGQWQTSMAGGGGSSGNGLMY